MDRHLDGERAVKGPPLVLVGGGEHAAVVADAATLQGFVLAGYADAQQGTRVEKSHQLVRLGSIDEAAAAHAEKLFIVCIGSMSARAAVAKRLEEKGLRFATIMHPRATISSGATIADGAAVLANAVVNVGAHVAAHAIVNSGSIVEHDVSIGWCTHVAPGVAIGGGARIGARTFVGLGARVRDHILVGDDVIIGMGAAVVGPVGDGARVVGIPARSPSQ